MITPKSEKGLRIAIENASTELIMTISGQGLAFQILLVNALIYLSNMAIARNAEQRLTSSKHILLKYQSKVLSQFSRQPLIDICQTVYI